MKKYILFTLLGFSIIFFIGAGVWVLKRPFGPVLDLAENIEIESEIAEPRWNREFSYEGNIDEAPDGIKHLAIQTHLIKNFQNVEGGYFLGYKYDVELQPQEQKLSKDSDFECPMLVSAYGLDFDFYFLDGDGYCLFELSTHKSQKERSPSDGYGYFIGMKESGLSRNNFTGYGQVIITDDFLSNEIAKRIKKVVYRPVFYPNFWSPVDQGNQTAIGSSST